MTATPPLVPLREAAHPVNRIVALSPGETYRQLGVRLWGQGAYEREPVDGSLTKYQQLFRAEHGDIVVNKIWARNGSVAVVDETLAGCHGSNEFPMFSPIRERLDPRWMHWVTKTRDFWAQCEQKSQGTSGQNRIKPERFLDVEIPLPPLDEQRRIVARIQELAEKVEQAHSLRSSAMDEQGALFHRALTTFFRSDTEGWVGATINDIALSLDAGWSPQCEDIPAELGKWGVLKTTSVQWCEFRHQENKRLPPSAIVRPELCVKAGDVLVTRAGPMKRVGVPATAREDYPRLMISDKIIRIRPKLGIINPHFLEYALSSPQAQEHLVARKTGLADAQVNISQAILRATPFSYPSLPEQVHIVTELDALQAKVDAVKALQTETAAELDAMLPAILDRAFKGKL